MILLLPVVAAAASLRLRRLVWPVCILWLCAALLALYQSVSMEWIAVSAVLSAFPLLWGKGRES